MHFNHTGITKVNIISLQISKIVNNTNAKEFVITIFKINILPNIICYTINNTYVVIT